MLKSVSPQLSPNSNPEPRVVRLTAEQEQVLEAQFERLKNPHSTDLVLLAAETGLQEADVQAWYAQRLSAWRKTQGLSAKFGTFN
ncbi:homeodomain-only protein-like [Periplaneta americana]|uniref:homeodomain-only protein-like n=1 Tax=Periplaneta americana TaxID=6978 RepID=UPI0037E7FED6